MLAQTQLTLVGKKIREISESPYFSKNINEYLSYLKNIADKLSEEGSNINEGIVIASTIFITDAVNFFSGSTSKKIPYEVVYCLNDACQQWTDENTLITTALSSDIHGFYFEYVNLSTQNIIEQTLNIKPSHDLIKISLPEIYRRRPLCSTPLYHELGHYIDSTIGFSEFASLNFCKKNKFDILPIFHNFDKNTWSNPDKKELIDHKQEMWTNHCREYFADLFSAQFVGRSGVDFLQRLAGNADASFTHPSTKDRVKVVEDFLSGNSNTVVDMLNNIISLFSKANKVKQSGLLRPSSPPDITSCFDNIRPFPITDRSHLHSFINEAWDYLCKTWDNPSGVWSELSKDTIESTVNDLVEKSIRNFMI
ncbi:hypothetical protein J3L11_18130, partial [Shewanella sp. 4t3-1-2LB]|uniref:hypothetical protein n=1 Tax=Shewanella sp. 4t3-1-2LB TaxID=2817682 RepID=UPI001A992EE4